MAADRLCTRADQPAPVEVRGLVTSFGEVIVHHHLNLTVRHGEVLGLVGGAGSGKSVLLRVLIGLKPPDAGQVRVFGHDLYAGPPEDIADVKRRWGVLFQGSALFSNLSVRENVEAPLVEHTNLPPEVLSSIAELKLALAGLPTGTGELRPAQLSGGMVKRVGIARALALEPELLLLDEPTSGLDPIAAGGFDELVLGLARALDLTIVMITHDLDSVYTICDRVAVLADKTVVAVAAPEDIRQSDHPWVQAYFGGARGEAARRAATATRAGGDAP